MDELRIRSFSRPGVSRRRIVVAIGRGTPFREPVIADGLLANQIARLHCMLARPGSVLARETAAVLAATALVTRHAIARQAAQEPTDAGLAMIRRIRAYPHNHLDANVSLSELSAIAGLPPHALVRAFTLRVGMRPHAYHLQVRVNRAKALLNRHAPIARSGRHRFCRPKPPDAAFSPPRRCDTRGLRRRCH